MRRLRPPPPGLIYHPHFNPLSTVPATLISASSRLQSLLPDPLRLSHLFGSSAPSDLPLPSPLASLANLATIPPIHVDTIGEAVCMAIADEKVQGVLDVKGMRGMLGFDYPWDLEGKQKDVGGP